MGAEVPKQFLMLGDKTILEHTVDRFRGFADRIIVVLPEGHPAPNGVESCSGGSSRFDSVRNALKLLETSEDSTVAVQDGVRPLVSRELIEKAFVLAEKHGAAIPCVAPVDSFRFEGAPIDRNKLIAIQTPQAFRAEILLDAYARAPHADFTDDATVVEAAGYALHFFDGERRNIKITTPEDLSYARLWI